MHRDVSAATVRAALFTALAPVQALCERFFGQSASEARLRFVIELHPLRVQIVVAPDEGRAASRLCAFEGDRLPDGGAALGAAVEAVAAAVLEGLPARTAEAVMVHAALPDRGMFVMADPADELALLALPGDGGDLGKGTLVGALVDLGETIH